MLRGAYYHDFSTMRVRDFAKVKAPKMIMTRSRIEFAAVRPGVIADDNIDASLKNATDFDVLKVVAIKKIKGMVPRTASINRPYEKWTGRFVNL